MDIGGNISDEEISSDHDVELNEAIVLSNDGDLAGDLNDDKKNDSGNSNEEIVQYQSRYGRTIKTNTAKYIHSDSQNEIILELDSDNENGEDVDMEDETDEYNNKYMFFYLFESYS